MTSFLSGSLPWVVGLVVLAAVVFVMWRLFGSGGQTPKRNDYLHALELWIEGEREDAAALLRKVVHENTDSVEPYLYLGNLLRLQGDAERAAVLHRGLTVRPNLTLSQKIAVGLSLAEDLNALARWEEAGQVLDSVLRHASDRSRYWKARFAQRHGAGDLPEAARTLKAARRQAPRRDRQWFQRAYASYQLDRALAHALAGEASAARARLKDVRDIPVAESRAALVAAISAALAGDTATAIDLASGKLLQSAEELKVVLPLLETALLASGHYARTIPILERACQADGAPASLWVDLAMLYEKLDQRDKALQLLTSKAGRADLTPDTAAPYLRMLLKEVPDSDAAHVWGLLNRPGGPEGWTCTGCGERADRVRWFCPACGRFDSFVAGPPAGEAV